MVQIPKHANTTFQRWWMHMSSDERYAFTGRLGVDCKGFRSNYIIPLIKPLDSHYSDKRPSRRQPSSLTMLRMAKAAKGQIKYKDIREHFYPL